MEISFYKYQGAGNDFVIIDDRENNFDKSNTGLVAFLCDRRFGIGGDGLMLLRNKAGFDFEMVYFNSDGKEASMCGNGGRCIVAFAKKIGVITDATHFIAVDGPHDASFISEEGTEWVSLKMIDVKNVESGSDYVYMDTGSPHYVTFSKDLQGLAIVEEARKIRYNDRFKSVGTNVNFIQMSAPEVLDIRTYERGVEDETLACGTGVTAAVLSAFLKGETAAHALKVKAQGGNLRVKFKPVAGGFEDIWLQGPAEFVFKGTINV